MTFHIISIIALIIVFVAGTFGAVNLGALGLVAAFAVGGLVLGETPDEVLAGFPADMFLLILGVTYLFGIATVNGTLEWLLLRMTRLVRGNAAIVPAIVFLIPAVLVSVGAVAPAVSAMFSRLALGLGKKLSINPVLMGLMVVIGGTAASFSPISLLGVITNSTLERNGLESSPLTLYLVNFGYNLVMAVVAYFVFGGRKLIQRRQSVAATVSGPGAQSAPGTATGGTTVTGTDDDADDDLRLTAPRIATLLGVVLLAVGMLGFGWDIGMLSLCIAVVLHLVFSSTSKGAMDRVSWHVIVLICGIVTFVALMERGGTIEWLGNSVAGLSAPLVAAFLMCLIGAVVSAFASSTGMITAMVALAVPFLASGDIGIAGMVAAITISATVVDTCPFSSTSALVVANTPEEDRAKVFRGLGWWATGMVLSAPVLTVGLIVAPGWL